LDSDINRDSLDFGWSDWDIDKATPTYTSLGRIGTSTRATITHNTTQNKREKKEKEEKALSEAANAEGCLQVGKA